MCQKGHETFYKIPQGYEVNEGEPEPHVFFIQAWEANLGYFSPIMQVRPGLIPSGANIAGLSLENLEFGWSDLQVKFPSEIFRVG